jgi:hypothetical protein
MGSRHIGRGLGASFVWLLGVGTYAMTLPGCSDASNGQDAEDVGAAEQALLGSTFEATDGNTAPNGGTDWDSAPPNLTTKSDLLSGTEDDSFGGGSKEDALAPKVTGGGIPNNKSDLTRFRVAHETLGTNAFLYLEWERANTLGTANMDFEFNQSSTLSANGVTPVRTEGDLLVTYDLTQGGAMPAISILTWSGSAWGNKQTLTGTQNPAAEASISADGKLGEAALNLTAANVVRECTSFGSAYVKGRSSASFNAELKDFIAPQRVNFTICEDNLIRILKVDPDGNALAGAVFQLFLDDGDGVLDAGDTQIEADCTTGADGICEFTVEAPFSGVKTLIAHELSPPPNFEGAGDQTATLAAGASSETKTLTFVNTPLRGAVDITKKDDAGNAVAGILFTLQGAGGSFSCTTDGSGACSMIGVPVGTYTLDEVVDPSSGLLKDPAYPQTVTVIGNQAVSFQATNPRRHRIVTLVCHESTDTLQSRQVTMSGGPTLSSIGAVPPHLAAKGVTEADLCALGGASFDHLASPIADLSVQ